MTQWDVYAWEFPHGTHPALVLSPPARCAHGETVNVLGCSSHRATRAPQVHEIILDEADGLDWPTLCRLDVVWLAARSELKQRRGTLSQERRRQLGMRLIRLYGLLIA